MFQIFNSKFKSIATKKNTRKGQRVDILEAILFKRLLEFDKPALGISNDLQLFNLLLGGTLYQDILNSTKSKNNIY